MAAISFYNTARLNLIKFKRRQKKAAETEAEYLRRIYDMVDSQVDMVSDTTDGIIRRIIRRGVTEGVGTETVAEWLRAALGESSPALAARAATIARTATHSAVYAAETASVQESLGEVVDAYRFWMATHDSGTLLTRPDHMEADGQRRRLDEPFEVGGEELMFPGDPAGSAAQIINCRCTIGYGYGR
jgi:uncharacterized protein with gpF-like domain